MDTTLSTAYRRAVMALEQFVQDARYDAAPLSDTLADYANLLEQCLADNGEAAVTAPSEVVGLFNHSLRLAGQLAEAVLEDEDDAWEDDPFVEDVRAGAEVEEGAESPWAAKLKADVERMDQLVELGDEAESDETLDEIAKMFRGGSIYEDNGEGGEEEDYLVADTDTSSLPGVVLGGYYPHCSYLSPGEVEMDSAWMLGGAEGAEVILGGAQPGPAGDDVWEATPFGSRVGHLFAARLKRLFATRPDSFAEQAVLEALRVQFGDFYLNAVLGLERASLPHALATVATVLEKGGIREQDLLLQSAAGPWDPLDNPVLLLPDKVDLMGTSYRVNPGFWDILEELKAFNLFDGRMEAMIDTLLGQKPA